VVGFCEHGNESSCSIKDGGFVDLLGDYQISRRSLLYKVVAVFRTGLNRHSETGFANHQSYVGVLKDS